MVVAHEEGEFMGLDGGVDVVVRGEE